MGKPQKEVAEVHVQTSNSQDYVEEGTKSVGK